MPDDSKAFLDHAAQAAVTDPIELTVRGLIAHWDAKRRGVWVIERIEGDLAQKGLTTDPSFADAWIDGPVRVVAISRGAVVGDDSTNERAEVASPSALDISLRVGSLPSANTAVVSVPPDASLTLAQSLMLRYDYSQLAVASGERDLRGAISWESIAQAQLQNPGCSLTRALIWAEPVELDHDLLALIPRIVSSGFVFVRASDRRISGIVTMADLSLEFSSLATPFFLLGEIERRLRRKVDQCFEPVEFEDLRDGTDSTREVVSASELTFGEYGRLIQNPEKWERLGWPVDRKTFSSALDEVREIRNEVMHFSPDQLEGWQVDALKNFIRWLRILEPS
ncbi:MAG: CBS domain-containing protein [Acidimicrobiales bacterium]